MKKRLNFLFILLALLLGYLFWSSSNRLTSPKDLFPRYVIKEMKEVGKNSGKGNCIALSPYFHLTDFSSKDAYFKMFQYYFDFAKKKKLLNDSTIIVLPEYVGTWLLIANEKKSVFQDTSINTALKTVVFSNLFSFTRFYLFSKASDKTTESVFKMKSNVMLDIYQSTFSRLAKKYKVTIVAGSIVLPEPSVKKGKIVINKSGKLYNISATFDTNGNVIQPLVFKKFLIKEEQAFTAPNTSSDIPVYKIKNSNVAVLICADAWYPQSFQQLKNKNIDLVVVPSFVTGKDAWNKKWLGYNGAPTPNDVDTSDIGNLSEHDAWLKYAMAGKILQSEIKTGVNVFFKGELWNLGTSGHTVIITEKNINQNVIPSIFEGKETNDKSGSLINVWLEE